MTTSTLAARPLPRDIWNDACGAAGFVTCLVILAPGVVPLVLDVEIPSAGGAAAVLISGATICLGLARRGARLAVASGLAILLALRVLSALRPDLLIAKHGALSALDAVALSLLILACLTMIRAASMRTHPARE
jgi:hypothetical protein